MNTVSKNSFDLIKTAGQKVKGNFSKAFFSTLIMFTPLIALCFIPYAGWAISMFLFGALEIGYIKYFRRVINNENPTLSTLLSDFKSGLMGVFLGVCLLVLYVIGSILLLVPGIIAIGYFSLSMYYAEYNGKYSVIESLKVSSKKMHGHLSAMISYKSLFWLAYFVLFALGLLGFWGVWSVWCLSPVVAVLVAIIAVLVFAMLYSLITVYYHAANEVFFQETLNCENKTCENKKVEEQKVVEEPAKVEEPKQEVKKTEPKKSSSTAAKKSTTKTTTKKTTTKK